ncbi:MAG: hypothetical protein NVSMB1_11340 [Polyangiales bacterium]
MSRNDVDESDRILAIASRILLRIGGVIDPSRLGVVSASIEKQRASGIDLLQIEAAVDSGDGAALEPLISRLIVAETYFFRHPNDFAMIAEDARHRISEGAKTLRAFSAGCATGEEAYSLAATLLAATALATSLGIEGASPVSVEVLGSDLVASQIESARRGRYGRWSMRGSVPLFPWVLQRTPGLFEVREDLRAVTKFEVFNLCDPPPIDQLGLFDFVMCRNVLMYLEVEAAKRALDQLVSCLKPGGILFLGALDGHGAMAEAVRHPQEGVNAFVRIEARVQAKLQTREQPLALTPLALLRAALTAIEANDEASARRLLETACLADPHYLVATFELSLCHARSGANDRARTLMSMFLRSIGDLPDDASLDGPQPLPVSYYRTAASTFLSRAEVT